MKTTLHKVTRVLQIACIAVLIFKGGVIFDSGYEWVWLLLILSPWLLENFTD